MSENISLICYVVLVLGETLLEQYIYFQCEVRHLFAKKCQSTQINHLKHFKGTSVTRKLMYNTSAKQSHESSYSNLAEDYLKFLYLSVNDMMEGSTTTIVH